MKIRIALLSVTLLTACSKGADPPADPAPAAPSEPQKSALARLTVPNVTYSTAQTDLDKGKDVFAAKGCCRGNIRVSLRIHKPGKRKPRFACAANQLVHKPGLPFKGERTRALEVLL